MVLDVLLLGLLVTSGGPLGTWLGMRYGLSRRVLGRVLAFGAGALIAAVSIELAFESAGVLMKHGYSRFGGWLHVAGGFLAGATVYLIGTRLLDRMGGNVRSEFRLRQSLELEKRQRIRGILESFSRSPVLGQLPPEQVGMFADRVTEVRVPSGRTVFRQGDAGDALYLVVSGGAEVFLEQDGERKRVASLGPGDSLGEMALLSGESRNATVEAVETLELLRMGREDFVEFLRRSPALSAALERLGHERALANVHHEAAGIRRWLSVASQHVERLTQRELDEELSHSRNSAGAAILLGNFLDVIPAAFVIGGNFVGWHEFSLPLAVGIFIADVPEGATSASMLLRAGFSRRRILLSWLAVTFLAGLAAVLGHLTIGAHFSPLLVVAEAFAGGAVLALVAQTLIPEAVDETGPMAALPLILGFLVSVGLIIAGSEGMVPASGRVQSKAVQRP
ncbi:MAG: cyclic nucleotide-binding domain-containing protein [Verrucomicrobiota bacterium]